MNKLNFYRCEIKEDYPIVHNGVSPHLFTKPNIKPFLESLNDILNQMYKLGGVVKDMNNYLIDDNQ